MSHFEQQATNWIAWARAPGHDVYWTYREPFFELLPAPGRALEVGCGEGRVSRDLAARGFAVTGVDSAPTLLEAAAAAHPEGRYLVADAASLPFEEGSFDLVVAYNSLMDMEAMDAAVAECARVLAPGGVFCACVTHPFADANHAPDVDYFAQGLFEGTFERDGLTMTFRGWTYPLEAYSRALEAAGLRIEALREPRGEDRFPMFLMFRARAEA
jgi:ubiquinone/menaquinone biosynthesis C-methylase UbiE